MDTTEKVKSRWTRAYYTGLITRADEERYSCDICHKDFSSPSNLTLHSDTHVIERKFRCEPCQVSFHSQAIEPSASKKGGEEMLVVYKGLAEHPHLYHNNPNIQNSDELFLPAQLKKTGHLQKHERSSAHETRVVMTQTFGIPTEDNPRPYGCDECKTAFRKHGHLAKHLRSKAHITKLESNGLIPTGTYTGLEKSSQGLKDMLVTTDCEQSLRSLRQIAMLLFNQQPIPNDSPGPSSVLSNSTSLDDNKNLPSSSTSVGAPMMCAPLFAPTASPQLNQPPESEKLLVGMLTCYPDSYGSSQER